MLQMYTKTCKKLTAVIPKAYSNVFIFVTFQCLHFGYKNLLHHFSIIYPFNNHSVIMRKCNSLIAEKNIHSIGRINVILEKYDQEEGIGFENGRKWPSQRNCGERP